MYMALSENNHYIEKYTNKNILLSPGYSAHKVNLVLGVEYLMHPDWL